MRLALFGLLICAVTAGCNRGPHVYPVVGKVVFSDGKPMPGGSVTFESQTPSGKLISARGVIETDGSFKLMTPLKGDGAIAGKHRVAVHPPLGSPEMKSQEAHPVSIPHRYEDLIKSGLEFTVKESNDNNFTITIERK